MQNGIIVPTQKPIQEITPTIDTTVINSGATIKCVKCGNVAQVFFYGVTFKSNGSFYNVITGIPKAKIQGNIYFSNNDNGWISDDHGGVNVNISDYSSPHWGGITYICAD